MASREPLSRGDIMSRVGIERDVMTFWIRGGVLQPMAGPTGPGKHLRFAWYEANIAAIMNQLRILGVKIEGMLSIGRVYREAIAFFEKLDVNHDEIIALFSLYYAGLNLTAKHLEHMIDMQEAGIDPEDIPHRPDAEVLAAFAIKMEQEIQSDELIRHGAQSLSSRVVDIYRGISHEDLIKYIDVYMSVTLQPEGEGFNYENPSSEEMTYFWRIGEGNDYRFAMGFEAAKLARQDGAISMIAVDVIAAVYRVWNDPAPEEDSE